jgi:tRNA dimethylallyltransferase
MEKLTNKKPKLIVILGPTATGKTALSIALAKKYNGEVISADSRQVYTGLNLGSGKVTKKEMDGIPHHLLDVVNPKKQFNVADYVKVAEKKMQEILEKGKTPIICGGTGLYIDTLLSGVILPEVPPNKKLRTQLEKKSAESLFKILTELDPARAKTIDIKNPVRLIRAIEIATTLGKVPKLEVIKSKYQTVKIGLDMPDEILKDRIKTRLTERLKAGMLNEAKRLHAKGLSWKKMEEFGLEYRAMAKFLTKKIAREDFESNLAIDIWHYVKRQRTWFKRDKNILWINPLQKSEVKKAEMEVKRFLK